MSQEPSKDIFVEAWDHLDTEPHEPMSRAQAAIGIEMVAGGNSDEIIGEGFESGILESNGSGLKIAGEDPEPDPEEDDDQEFEYSDSDSKEEPIRDPEEMERSELEEEVVDLREEVDSLNSDMTAMSGRLDALNAGVNELRKMLVGTTDVSTVVDTDNMTDVWTRLDNVSADVDEHEDKLQMFEKGDGKNKAPDERALTIRSVLYERAKSGSENVGKMTRDECDTALGGGMSRYQLMEAMRRAANGREAQINGSSDLDPMSGVEVIVFDRKNQQSKIRMNLDDTTAQDLRLNNTTEDKLNRGPE